MKKGFSLSNPLYPCKIGLNRSLELIELVEIEAVDHDNVAMEELYIAGNFVAAARLLRKGQGCDSGCGPGDQ